MHLLLFEYKLHSEFMSVHQAKLNFAQSHQCLVFLARAGQRSEPTYLSYKNEEVAYLWLTIIYYYTNFVAECVIFAHAHSLILTAW